MALLHLREFFAYLGVPLPAKSLAQTQSPLFVQESPSSYCFPGSLNTYYQQICGQSTLDPGIPRDANHRYDHHNSLGLELDTNRTVHEACLDQLHYVE